MTTIYHLPTLRPFGGGKEGGKIVATGTPEEVAECKKSETGKFLREELKKVKG